MGKNGVIGDFESGTIVGAIQTAFNISPGSNQGCVVAQIRGHSCHLRAGHRGYSSHRVTKIGQRKTGKTSHGLVSLNFSWIKCNKT